MRLAVTLAQDIAGKWSLLSSPDVAIIEQKKLFKKIKSANGKLNGKQQAFIATWVKPVKKAKFVKEGLVEIPKSVPGIPRAVAAAKEEAKAEAKEAKAEAKEAKAEAKAKK